MRIAYFGLPLGACLLVADGHALNPIVLTPMEAPGRRRLVARVGEERLVDADAPAPDMLARVRDAKPELLVSWFWTRKLPREILSAPPLGAIGAHPSLLPRHRGPDPYFWAIDSGDLVTGVTLHELAEEYDTGRILATEPMLVGNRSAHELARALDRPSLRLLRRTVAALAQGTPLERFGQLDSLATLAPKPSAAEERVDFRWSTERVLRRIRALSPVPGLALELRGVRFFVTRAERARWVPLALEPGEALVEELGVSIRTGDGAIRLERVELASWVGDESETDETETPNDENVGDLRLLDGIALARILAPLGQPAA